MTLNQWIRSPKGYVTAALSACLLFASLGSGEAKGIGNAIAAVGLAVLADLVLRRLTRKKPVPPDGAAITGLIIALVLSTTASWAVTAVTAVLAIGSKHFLTYKNKPVFNPAAFGLLLSIILFGTGQSWWGAFGDLPAWTVIVLLAGGYAVTDRVNKYPQVFAFFGTYFVLLLLMGLNGTGDAADALRPPFINAALFFGLFMLTDPPTSPAKPKEQVVFGVVAAGAGALVYALFGGLMYLFIGLLLGNLYHWRKARLKVTGVRKENPSFGKTGKGTLGER
ncbi:RnfABCDGE type electron transport complex subunit D [Paenibacillus aurantius]|uniref:RnfABCDGE type electron transport complex subunit D n=1 Tax=Paenibacillus aurantius TaxID=2918900 RepID=A0AA96LFI3_9BACL|nr:RnfABCDGE type electron transport complex subunit D [Paenibacillus aurantius]WNQ12831.1 RnfABCDGE type electron transport complex subunit D [Paenibacillus aurantius]